MGHIVIQLYTMNATKSNVLAESNKHIDITRCFDYTYIKRKIMKKIVKRGILTVAFDDGYLATYEHAVRYLDKLNIKSTLAVPFSFVGKRLENRPVVGKKELKACIKAGHEIASHGLMHTNLLKLVRKNTEEALLEIVESKKAITRSLDRSSVSFVFPYIKKNYSRSLLLKTKRHYMSARITSGRPCFNKIPLKSPFPVTGFAVGKKHSSSYLNKLVDYAEKNNLWLIEVFHLVSDRNTLSARRPRPYRYFTHINDFKRHIDYIASKEIQVLPQKAAVSL